MYFLQNKTTLFISFGLRNFFLHKLRKYVACKHFVGIFKFRYNSAVLIAIISTLSHTRLNSHTCIPFKIRTMYCVVLCVQYKHLRITHMRIPRTTIWPHKCFNRNNKRAYVIRCGRVFLYSTKCYKNMVKD